MCYFIVYFIFFTSLNLLTYVVSFKHPPPCLPFTLHLYLSAMLLSAHCHKGGGELGAHAQ